MNGAATSMIRIRGVVLLALWLAACGADAPSPFRGALYFGQGAYVMRLGLQDAGLSVVGHLGDTVIRDVSAFGRDHLLIVESASLNRRQVSRISWFDRKTGEKGDLYGGVRARYLATADVLVYDDGTALFAVPQADLSANELIMSHPQSRITWMIEASPGVLLLESLQAGRYTIQAWDAGTRELRRLDGLAAACRLEGAVWIGPLERLACRPRGEATASTAYRLADLEGGHEPVPNLPGDGTFFALAYIDDQRTLVLQETWHGWFGNRDRHAVWLVPIDSWEGYRLADDVNLGRSVVYQAY